MNNSLFSKISSAYNFLESSDKPKFWFILFLMLIGMLFEIGGISILLPLMSVIMESDIEKQYPSLVPLLEFFDNPSRETIVLFSLAFVLIYYAIKSTYLVFLAKTQAKFTYHIKSVISQKLFNTYINQSFSFHLRNNSSDLIRNITSEITHFADGILKQMLFLGVETAVVIGIGILLFIIDPITMSVIIFTLGFGSIAYYLYTKNNLIKWGAIRQKNESARIKHLQQALAGIKEVKISGKESNFINAFRKRNLLVNDVEGNQFFYTFLPRILLETLAVITLILLIFSLLLQGTAIESIIPILAVFAAGAFRVLPSVTRIMHAISQLRFETPVLLLFIKEMELHDQTIAMVKESNTYNEQTIEPIKFDKEIHLENISYSYYGSNGMVLSDINIKINKNEVIGFVGESGAGKSTLINILLGLLNPTKGRILCDTIDITKNIRSWQQLIGYVPQSVFLTDDTVINNIAFGEKREDINMQKVNKAIKYAQLQDLVSGLEQGLETNLGERGVRLSGGQIQRMGIARALYNDPPILVFDEASSALDNETEKEIVNAIESLESEKTIFMVAHRISTLKNCNKIFTLKKGKIIKESDYEEILKEI
jgi:ATP-binding cassette, subfamily B, bacterial PglK